MSVGGGFGDPGTSIVAVTASDSTDLTGARAFFYTGTAGDVAIKTVHGASASSAVTIADCPANVIIPIQITRIMSTGTTATQIYAIY